MNHEQAISTLRHAYQHVLYLRADELPAYVWARTLGTLQIAKDKVIAEGIAKMKEQGNGF